MESLSKLGSLLDPQANELRKSFLCPGSQSPVFLRSVICHDYMVSVRSGIWLGLSARSVWPMPSSRV